MRPQIASFADDATLPAINASAHRQGNLDGVCVRYTPLGERTRERAVDGRRQYDIAAHEANGGGGEYGQVDVVVRSAR